MESLWCGWRRKKGTDGPWEHFAAADRPTRGQCYQALMDGSELSAHEGQYEYFILPAGQKPKVQQYRDRMLRPGGY